MNGIITGEQRLREDLNRFGIVIHFQEKEFAL